MVSWSDYLPPKFPILTHLCAHARLELIKIIIKDIRPIGSITFLAAATNGHLIVVHFLVDTITPKAVPGVYYDLIVPAASKFNHSYVLECL